MWCRKGFLFYELFFTRKGWTTTTTWQSVFCFLFLLFFIFCSIRNDNKINKSKNVVGVVAHLVEHPLGVGEARGSKPCNSNYFFFL